MRKFLMATVATGALAIAASSAVAGTWVAGVPVSGSSSTAFFGINENGVVAGDYIDSSGVTHGFYGPFDGSNYQSFDDAGGTTQPRAINNHGLITGYDTGTLTPWERFTDGTITNVTKKDGTVMTEIAQGLNKDNVFAANWFNAKGASIGYLGRNALYKKKDKITVPNYGWAARAVDQAGDTVGWIYDASGVQHGFVSIGGNDSQIDYPGSVYTVMEGLNDRGIAVGQYEDASGVIHGFIYNTKKGSFQDLTAPGAALTQVWSINNKGVAAASADIGPFIYCMKAKSCPGSKDAVKHPPQHQAKYVPAKL